jgi:hypothetical protein
LWWQLSAEQRKALLDGQRLQRETLSPDLQLRVTRALQGGFWFQAVQAMVHFDIRAEDCHRAYWYWLRTSVRCMVSTGDGRGHQLNESILAVLGDKSDAKELIARGHGVSNSASRFSPAEWQLTVADNTLNPRARRASSPDVVIGDARKLGD